MSLLNLYNRWVHLLEFIEETLEYQHLIFSTIRSHYDELNKSKTELLEALANFKVLTREILAHPNVPIEVFNIVNKYSNLDTYVLEQQTEI